MIEFIFTLDYEIYGNGLGSLKSEVYEPAEKLLEVFSRYGARLVFFLEVAELEKMEETCSDPFISSVLKQIRNIIKSGHEAGLHIHPQWYEARLEDGRWLLNFSEYNLCLLPEERISELVNRGLKYLRYLVGDETFCPVAYRAGNWLMQPSKIIARVLSGAGLKIDSSVFRGGYQKQTGLDYRLAPADRYFWKFTEDVVKPDNEGLMTEIPVYTRLVPPWKLLNQKRLKLEGMDTASGLKNKLKTRLKDFLRFRVPQKFDFCRLDLAELKSFTAKIIDEDRKSPQGYKPIVLIGHTKDRPEVNIIESFLKYLREEGIKNTTFEEAWSVISQGQVK